MPSPVCHSVGGCETTSQVLTNCYTLLNNDNTDTGMQAMKYVTATLTCVRTERAGGRSSLSHSDSCASARHASVRAPLLSPLPPPLLPPPPLLHLHPAQTVKASKGAQRVKIKIAKVARMMLIECLLHALKMKASTSS